MDGWMDGGEERVLWWDGRVVMLINSSGSLSGWYLN